MRTCISPRFVHLASQKLSMRQRPQPRKYCVVLALLCVWPLVLAAKVVLSLWTCNSAGTASSAYVLCSPGLYASSHATTSPMHVALVWTLRASCFAAAACQVIALLAAMFTRACACCVRQSQHSTQSQYHGSGGTAMKQQGSSRDSSHTTDENLLTV